MRTASRRPAAAGLPPQPHDVTTRTSLHSSGLLAVVTACLLFLLPVSASANEPELDIDYAELQPLATSSMLLDVTRIGDRYVAVGERGHVVWSDDGTEWRQADTVPTRSTLTTVTAAGGRLWAAGHDAVIITSGDRGKTWSRQYFDPERQQAVMDLYFTDASHGMAIGSYGLFMVTEDGGLNWEDAVVDEENEFHLNAMLRYPDGRRMIAGEAGYSYRSFDDGESWELMELPYNGSMWGAILTSGECALLFGLRGHAMQSCDFGDSWIELDTGTEASLSDAAEQEGLVVIVGNSGTVLTWSGEAISSYTHSSGVDFAGVVPFTGGRFLLVGEDGVHLFPEHVEVGNGR